MTSETSDPSVPPQEEGPVPAPELDWFLQTLVQLANDKVVEFPVTLHVKGVTITGNVMGGRSFFERWADEMAGGFQFAGESPEEIAESRESTRATFARFGEMYPDKTIEERQAAGEVTDTTPPNYIHLRDAQFFLGESLVPTNRPVLWRGRLSQVDGFTLGTMARGSD